MRKTTLIAATITVWIMIMLATTSSLLHTRTKQLQAQIDSIPGCDLTELETSLGELDNKVDHLGLVVARPEDVKLNTDKVRSDMVQVMVQLERLDRQEPVESMKWVQLPGTWALTWYGSDADGFLYQKHGAAWNGLECPDWSALTTSMPDVVDMSHYGLAMPGPEFFCMPVKVCVSEKCIVATAVDVPRNDWLELDDTYYSHVDVWPVIAEELGIKGAGVVTQNIKVYIGEER